MIKVETKKSINFIDKYDIFVGFDLEFQCCESYGWYIKSDDSVDDVIERSQYALNCLEEEEFNLNDWCFDIDYFKYDDFDTKTFTFADVVVFKINKGNEVKYLFLFNVGNGMYAHDFFFGKSYNSFLNRDVKEENICFHKGKV